MASYVCIGNRLLNLRHVTTGALGAGRVCLVMRVLLDGWRPRAVRRGRPVTIKARYSGRLPQERIMLRAVRVMATKAGDTARVHRAGNVVVTLHAILMGGPVRKVSERSLSKRVFFKLPEVSQITPHFVANRPVVVFTLNWTRQGLTLRMALNADIIGPDVIQASWIHDIQRSWLLHVIAARTVTLLTAHIPFRHGLCLDVVVHGMASVAQGARRALEVVLPVIPGPPVRTGLGVVGAPNFVDDVPLRGLGEEIIADFFKIPLLPFAAIDERDVAQPESQQWVGF